MMLMGLGVKCGDTVTFTVEGGDEETAAKAIGEFMSANL
jgi:phosphocarrier protein